MTGCAAESPHIAQSRHEPPHRTCPLPGAKQTAPFVGIAFAVAIGYGFLHCICLLMTQSGHPAMVQKQGFA